MGGSHQESIAGMPLLSPLLARSGWPACIGSIAEIDGDIDE
jgi:hypothetical protein